MILPLWVCLECGKFGGLGLSFQQTMDRSSKGERYKEGDSNRVYCPDGHGLMYKVQDGDRLHVVSDVVKIEREGMNGNNVSDSNSL
jgi:Zn finger protein HypA/HybF involved in hydrogenase expression